LADPQKVIYESITDLAVAAGVGDATILRFCRKIGYKGYYAFKLSLAQELSSVNDAQINLQNLSEANAVSGIINERINANIQAISETHSLIDPKQVEKAAEAMLAAKKILFFGSGMSNLTAMDAMYKFMRVGMNVIAHTDPHYQSMAASLLQKNDVAIAFSFSGSTKDTINVMRVAKDVGAVTICITHHLKSPITSSTDFVLLMGSKEGPFEGGALETKINQLIVVDILYNYVFQKIEQSAKEAKGKATRSIIDKLY
jgi:DNA-binding MurR/RpiR family transcriptional regulator